MRRIHFGFPVLTVEMASKRRSGMLKKQWESFVRTPQEYRTVTVQYFAQVRHPAGLCNHWQWLLLRLRSPEDDPIICGQHIQKSNKNSEKESGVCFASSCACFCTQKRAMKLDRFLCSFLEETAATSVHCGEDGGALDSSARQFRYLTAVCSSLQILNWVSFAHLSLS